MVVPVSIFSPRKILAQTATPTDASNYNPATDSAPKSYTATYYTYTLLDSDDYGYYYYIPDYDDDDVVLYVDEYGSFTPAHPDADDYDDFMYEDDFGYFMPAHPDAD